MRSAVVDRDALAIVVPLALFCSCSIDGHHLIFLLFGAKTFRQFEHLAVLDLLGGLGALSQQVDTSARFTYNCYSRHLTRVVWVLHQLLQP
jgi:hypothetical protein